ncbi:type II secretion system F family protein [Nocardioides donggukensis]|uniref:Type II secretion system F family protein n=1 Tax=Nocardioides donggukensis TaxID=2774019 RepID=A0A927K5Z3_9ACTN|nr:type II secretion system F family protein [Nocardioides donggukensis]MBD8870922.1 type II secretion system F family protein [Nocardioides donggukensis]
MSLALLSATGLALSVLLARPSHRYRSVTSPARTVVGRPDGPGRLRRHRATASLLCGLPAAVWLDPSVAWVVGPALAAGGFWLLGRVEPVASRRAREQAEAELPQVVLLLGLVLRTGSGLGDALDAVSRALPGPASTALVAARAELLVGVPPTRVWAALAARPGLGPLGRALERAERSGAPVADQVRRLADDLHAERRSVVEDRARAVGVRAALPLGLCLLPAFLLLGIVPVVVTTLGALSW